MRQNKFNKYIFVLGTTTTLSVSSLIGASATILNSNNIDVKNNNTRKTDILSIDAAEKQGIKIRTNPINGFDSLDVSDGSGNKLVLTTVQKPNKLKTYGIALVNFESNEMFDHWEIPNDVPPEQPDKPEADNSNNTFFVKKNEISNEPYVVNYTTNIIPGDQEKEFFVLASISNLADALNTVYTEYNQDNKEFKNIVGAAEVENNLKKAPSIKIFKLKINANNTLELNKQAQDKKQGYYDFKYPDFKNDEKSPDGGLKFFTKQGIFTSVAIQQRTIANIYYDSKTFLGMGYMQYLQFGQLFQYDYEHKTQNLENTKPNEKDAFALIASHISNDPQMGNLYAFYSTITDSLAPAISVVDYFFNEVLDSLISNGSGATEYYKGKFPFSVFDNNEDAKTKTVPYKTKKDKNFKVKYEVLLEGKQKHETVNQDGYLKLNTAMAIAFMSCYIGSDTSGGEKTDHSKIPSTEGDKIGNIKRDSKIVIGNGDNEDYGYANYFVPGWFLFKPSKENNFLSYGYSYAYYKYGSSEYPTMESNGKAIWGTTIGSFYNSKTKNYYSIFMWSKYVWSWCAELILCKIDYFNVKNRPKTSDGYPLKNDQYYVPLTTKDDKTKNILVRYSYDPKAGEDDYIQDLEHNRKEYISTFVKVLDIENNIVAVTLSKDNKANVIILNGSKKEYKLIWEFEENIEFKNNWFNFQYVNKMFVALNNKWLFAMHFDINDNESFKKSYKINKKVQHEISLTESIIRYMKIINVTKSSTSDLGNNTNISAFQLTINNGFTNSKITDNIKDLTNHFMIQKNTYNNNNTLLNIITPSEVGYYLTGSVDELDNNVLEKNPDDFLSESNRWNLAKDFNASYEHIKPEKIKVQPDGLKVINYSKTDGFFELSSIIKVDNQPMLGFTLFNNKTIKDMIYGDVKYLYNDFSKLYYVVFNTLEVIKEEIKNNPYKNKTVADIVLMFDNLNDVDLLEFKRSMLELIVNVNESEIGEDENLTINYSIELDDKNTDISANIVSFYVIDSQGNKVKVKNLDTDEMEKDSIRLPNIFISTTSIKNKANLKWVIVGVSCGVILILLLGLGIGIPLNKASKTSKLANKKVDKLRIDVGNVFKKMNDYQFRKKKTPMLLQNKKRPTSPTFKKPNSSIGPKSFNFANKNTSPYKNHSVPPRKSVVKPAQRNTTKTI